jgi:hypothetical protein
MKALIAPVSTIGRKQERVRKMSYRIQIKMKWVITYGAEDTPFAQDKDFYAYARRHLQVSFANYNADLRFYKAKDLHGQMAEFDVEWDVDLDQVPGAWHQPEDHARYARSVLHDNLRAFSNRITVDVLRHPTENDPDGATSLVAWDDGFPKRDFDAFKARMEDEDAAAA